jgi:hypothetical protein
MTPARMPTLADSPMNGRLHRLRCGEVQVGFVSELCHMPQKFRVNTAIYADAPTQSFNARSRRGTGGGTTPHLVRT